jgi:hypothetical protein
MIGSRSRNERMWSRNPGLLSSTHDRNDSAERRHESRNEYRQKSEHGIGNGLDSNPLGTRTSWMGIVMVNHPNNFSVSTPNRGRSSLGSDAGPIHKKIPHNVNGSGVHRKSRLGLRVMMWRVDSCRNAASNQLWPDLLFTFSPGTARPRICPREWSLTVFSFSACAARRSLGPCHHRVGHWTHLYDAIQVSVQASF